MQMLSLVPAPLPAAGPCRNPARPPASRHPLRVPRPRRRSPVAPLEPIAAAPAAPPEARALLSLYAPLVRQIAGGFQRKLPRNVLHDDLVAAGMSGLWDAIVKHGDEHDDGFEWYVRVRIRGAILDELRAQDWLPRRARSEAGGDAPPLSVVRIEDVGVREQARFMTAGEGVSAEAAVERKLVRAALELAIGKLPERERHIVSKHYFDGVKFKDLGAELGVSEPRISQLHSRAMQRLRGLMDEAA